MPPSAAVSAPLLFARAIERTAREPGKEQGDRAIGEEAGMSRAGGPALAQFVGVGGKDDGKQGEEQAGNLEPDDAAGMGKGPPDGPAKTACPAGDSFAALGVHLRKRRLAACALRCRGRWTGTRSAVQEHL